MAVTDARDDPADDSTRTISALRASPERVVFTERGNTDGWIATDRVVELER